MFAVAQNRDAVTDRIHLGQPVRDVEYRAAFALDGKQRGENALDLHVCQRRGRLVENEHARVARQQARDLDQLALAHAQRGHRRIELDVGGAE